MEPGKIEFSFAPFSDDALSSSVPTFAYLFEGQEDSAISGVLPELEERRKSVDLISSKKEIDTITVQSIVRKGEFCVVGMIYIEYPWKKRKVIDVVSINFLRDVAGSTMTMTRRARDERFEEINILLPDRFSPRNVKDRTHREQLYFFVRTIAESIIYTNNSFDELMSQQEARVKKVNLLFFGEGQPALDGFFRQAIGDGEDIGTALAYTRRLIELPPNLKTPLLFVKEATGVSLKAGKRSEWFRFRISSRVSGALLYGAETLRSHSFNLIAAVGGGSKEEPCLLKIHYKPETSRKKRVKKIVLTGKAVTFDSGGYDIKGYYDNMHFDVGGAANILGVMKLAEAQNLSVELVAIIPVVENLIGPGSMVPGSIYRAFNGKTVKVINTDGEGRLILADAIAYSEAKVKPDATITLGTLSDMADFGPDFLKVLATTGVLERRARVAERLSAEKMIFLPRMEYFNKVDELHQGKDSDLLSDPLGNEDPAPSCYHVAPAVFLYNFFESENVNWVFVDVSAIFERSASDYGAGPGFGLKFLWHLLKQFR